MVSQHVNPRLLLLGGSLEYQKVSNKLASLNNVLQQITSLKCCNAEGPASFGDSPTVGDEPYKKRMRRFDDSSDKQENSSNGNIFIDPREHAPEVVLYKFDCKV